MHLDLDLDIDLFTVQWECVWIIAVQTAPGLVRLMTLGMGETANLWHMEHSPHTLSQGHSKSLHL